MLTIRIIGTGCERCNQLAKRVIKVLADLNVVADVQHDRDIKKFEFYKLFGTPVLKINGEIKSLGRVPSKSDLKKWMKKSA